MSIASAITALQGASSDIASAIAAKGVTVPAGSGFDDYASLIASIPTGGGGTAFGSRISYLESSGTQYISTGYVPNANTRLILDAALTEVAGVTMAGLNVKAGTAIVQRFNVGVYNSQWHCGISSKNAANKWYNFTSPATDTQRHTFEIRGDGYCAVDSTTNQITVDNTGTYANAIYLFARNDSGSIGAYASMRLYGAIIKENDTVIHNYVPIRIGQVGYLLDTISGEVLRNLGTGAFTLGTDISNS